MMLHDNKWNSVPSTPTPGNAANSMVQLSGVQDQFIDSYGYGSNAAPGGSVPLANQPMYMGTLPPRHDAMEPPRPASAIGTYGTTSRLESTGAIRGSIPIPDRRYPADSSPYPMPFMGSPYGASPFGGMRKRRADPLAFSVESGPFFGPTQHILNLFSLDHSAKYTPNVNAKIDRGFFQADNDWTCYRRNYFQVSAAFNLGGSIGPMGEADLPCVVEVEGRFHPVVQFMVGLTAKVSNNDKKIDLIQHTPKRDKGPQTTPEPRPIRAGGNLSISSVGSNSSIVTYERIQFKTATANNGKRRAAQQYYVLVVELIAKCDNGQCHKVATTQSVNLVVRGRSPGHYADSHAHAHAHDRFAQHSFMDHPSSLDERYIGMNAGPYPSYPQYSPFPSYHSSPMMMSSHGGHAELPHPSASGSGDMFAAEHGSHDPSAKMGGNGNTSSGLNIQGLGVPAGSSQDAWGRRMPAESNPSANSAVPFGAVTGYSNSAVGYQNNPAVASGYAPNESFGDSQGNFQHFAPDPRISGGSSHNNGYGYPEDYVYSQTPAPTGGEPMSHVATDYSYYGH